MGNLAEHQLLGNSVSLKGLSGDTAEPLRQANGLELSFGDLLGLAGDFFGAKGSGMIAAGASDAEREKRFLTAYECLAKDEECEPLVKELLIDAKREKETVLKGMAEGKKAIQIYDEGINSDAHFELDSWWWWKRDFRIKSYANLAAVNIDHFGKAAVEAYSAGHRLAMKTMEEAFSKKDDAEAFRKLLLLGYSMEGFACHYLTDLFAAGHNRTPRELLLGIAAGNCAWYQHREDGNLGLLVSNERGDDWKAYGDGHWFDEHDDDVIPAKKIIVAAIQAACDSLFDVANGGAVPSSPVGLSYTPSILREGNHNPLFRIKEGTENNAEPVPERRTDLSDPQSSEYIDDWSALGTWSKLKWNNVGAKAK